MATPEKGTVDNPNTELAGAEVRDNIDTHNDGITFEPLFDNEGVTEAQLMGEDDPGEKAADPEPKDVDAEAEAAAKEEAEKTDEQKEAELKGEPEKDAKKEGEDETDKEGEKPVIPKEVEEELAKKEEHISGLTAAVREEREQVKRLKQENQRLAAENQTLKSPKPDDDKEAAEFKDFKVLSSTEYDELLDDDPDEASRYLYKFNRYRDYQERINKSQLSEHQAKSAENEIVNFGIQELERVLPGVTEGKNEMAGKLTEFAVKNGIAREVLSVLTDPRTKVTTVNGENLIVGDGAAQLVQLIKSTYDAVSNVPTKEAIEAELRPKIEAEVQAKLIEKLKQDPSGGFRSLDQLAGSGAKDVKPISGTLSESDYARLSEDEQRAALGG